MTYTKLLCATAAVTLLLSACGGGGGAPEVAGEPNPPPAATESDPPPAANMAWEWQLPLTSYEKVVKGYTHTPAKVAKAMLCVGASKRLGQEVPQSEAACDALLPGMVMEWPSGDPAPNTVHDGDCEYLKFPDGRRWLYCGAHVSYVTTAFRHRVFSREMFNEVADVDGTCDVNEHRLVDTGISTCYDWAEFSSYLSTYSEGSLTIDERVPL